MVLAVPALFVKEILPPLHAPLVMVTAFCPAVSPAVYLALASTFTVYPVCTPWLLSAAVPSQITTDAVFPFQVAAAAVSCTLLVLAVPALLVKEIFPPLQLPLVMVTSFCPAVYLAPAFTVTVYPVFTPLLASAPVPSQMATVAVFPFQLAAAATSCTLLVLGVPALLVNSIRPPLHVPLLMVTAFCPAVSPAVYLALASTFTVYPVCTPWLLSAAVPSQITTEAVFPSHTAAAAVSCTLFVFAVPALLVNSIRPPLHVPFWMATEFCPAVYRAPAFTVTVYPVFTPWVTSAPFPSQMATVAVFSSQTGAAAVSCTLLVLGVPALLVNSIRPPLQLPLVMVTAFCPSAYCVWVTLAIAVPPLIKLALVWSTASVSIMFGVLAIRVLLLFSSSTVISWLPSAALTFSV